MAIVVEHEKRKHEILQKALDVFITEGYEDATYQKIADKCGITRSTLYIYFKNKQEIFGFSIKQLLTEIETSLLSILKTPELSNEQILKKVMETLIDISLQNTKLFEVLLPYLIQLKNQGKDPNKSVKRRVLRVRHLISSLVIQGVKSKEFKDVNIHATGELLYGLVESSIFRISVLNQKNVDEIKKAMNVAIDGILA